MMSSDRNSVNIRYGVLGMEYDIMNTQIVITHDFMNAKLYITGEL